MSYFRTQSVSHCGCGPVEEKRSFKKPAKEKKEKTKCEGCFCHFAKKFGMASFSSVTIRDTEYTTEITIPNIVAHILGNKVLVSNIQLVGCPKKNCCVTLQFTPLTLAEILAALGLADVAALLALLLALLPDLTEALLTAIFGGAPFFRVVDCEKVSSFAPTGNGMMMF
ncbi:hypothetical protein RYX56_04685 [Alkalihalophilus lindianensis]|uniref:Uncharacterized protein n=1 Tax=Alkalihalophilus lindianensis TaxID=1630542 RepID=A0ABU3X700_9BACI|nr:hypothetical protein [Alkalihalophilus lindianensis]MDV2683671.1 hypothetical protein [Alkalihalophilus lindianensis]